MGNRLLFVRGFYGWLATFFWSAVLFAQDKDINVKIETDRGEGGWPGIYWLIGGLVLALIVAIVAMASRSSSKA